MKKLQVQSATICSLFYYLRYMAQRKPYNPNTKYGRKKLREQSEQYYNNLPEEQKQEFDNTKTIVIIIIVVIVIIIGLVSGNMSGTAKWLSH